MYQNEIYRKRLVPSNYAITSRPIKSLHECSCGRLTFLDFPCGNCGNIAKKVFINKPGATDRIFQLVMLAGTALGGIAAATISGILIHWKAAFVVALAAIVFTALNALTLSTLDSQERHDYWRLHAQWKPLFQKKCPYVPAVEARCIQPVLDAWYFDIDRLERMALQGKWEQALYGARQLGCVYRNARLSRLQYQALLHLSLDGRESFDLDEICANLKSDDIPDSDILPVLHLIGDSVRMGHSGCQDNMKRLFVLLLQRYLELLQRILAYDLNIHDSGSTLCKALGTQIFCYCGGIDLDNGRLPLNEDGMRVFCDRLIAEIRRNRQQYVANGNWCLILFGIRAMAYSKAADVLYQAEICFFRRDECVPGPDFYTGFLRDIDRGNRLTFLLPEQRKYFSDILGYWVIDENGELYSASDICVIRELAQEGENGQQISAAQSENTDALATDEGDYQ